MKVFRLSRAAYSSDLSGKGAEKGGGRWNSRGLPMIYTSQHISLCMAEIAVHSPLGIIPINYELITLEIPEEEVTALPKGSLPENWREAFRMSNTQKLGDEFLNKGEKLILKVPSAVVAGEFNFLINPRHPKIKKVKILSIRPFEFDSRLFVR